MSQRTYYEVLGLQRNATDAEIKAAYRKLALVRVRARRQNTRRGRRQMVHGRALRWARGVSRKIESIGADVSGGAAARWAARVAISSGSQPGSHRDQIVPGDQQCLHQYVRGR